MTSRELVKKTLAFDKAKRIPRQLWALPWVDLHHPEVLKKITRDFPSDFGTPEGVYEKEPRTKGDPHVEGEYTDPWGCLFQNKQAGIIGEVKQPLLKDWSELDKVRIPTEYLSLNIDKVNAYCRNTDLFTLSGLVARPFEQLQFIRGTENLYIDLMDEPPELKGLLSKMHQFYLDHFELWAKTEVDGLFFMDDWGAQQSLLVRPDLWRKIFKPLYKDYIDLAHRYGKKAFFHSDGYILDIYPDLVELGLDALNSQIFCMGIDKLLPYKGQITFWGEMDRQHLLPEGSPREIEEAVRHVYNTLYQDGGVIAQCEFGPGAKPENVYAVFEAWEKLG